MDKKYVTKPIIFLISGYARAGKDTYAEFIKKHVNKDIYVYRINFADELKVVANEVLGSLGLKRHGNFFDDAFKTANRPVLTAIGNMARSIDPDIFVKKFIATFDCLNNGRAPAVYICSDWRYVNEYTYLVKHLDNKSYIVPRYVRKLGSLPANEEEKESIKELTQFVKPEAIYADEGHLDTLEQFGINAANYVNDYFEQTKDLNGQ